MGRFRTSKEVRRLILTPLTEMAANVSTLCDSWDESVESGKLVRPDLLINESMALSALATLRKYVRDLSGKLQTAEEGVYRYRDFERKHPDRKS